MEIEVEQQLVLGGRRDDRRERPPQHLDQLAHRRRRVRGEVVDHWGVEIVAQLAREVERLGEAGVDQRQGQGERREIVQPVGHVHQRLEPFEDQIPQRQRDRQVLVEGDVDVDVNLGRQILKVLQACDVPLRRGQGHGDRAQ